MKLNAYIIQKRLSLYFPVKMYGDTSEKMELLAPEFYMDNSPYLHSCHVYLATAEHLSHRPSIEKNAVLVCIGDSPRLSYYKEHATVLLIQKKVDFFDVFQKLQDIYMVFYNWESRLLKEFMNPASIQDILDCSYPVFQCPIYVLDASFQFVASVFPSGFQSHLHPASPVKLSSEDFLCFLKEKDLRMDTHGTFLMEMETGTFLCTNLFNSNDDYIGCMYIDLSEQTYIKGDEFLAQYLADIITNVSERIPALLNNEQSSLKQILQTLLKEMPLNRNQKLLLKTCNQNRDYYCISIHCVKKFSALPANYVCSVLEERFADSIFFEQANTILGLIPFDNFSKDESLSSQIEQKISTLLEEMKLCLGVSNDFSDLYLLRTYYQEAEAAIENGLLYHLEQKVYLFSEFALSELIANSFGSFPVDAYLPNGFRRLLLHDSEGDVSYLETLAVFLEENMSYSRAARRLFIHRSTLIERISRIEGQLSLNLSDPDQRLQLQIILKALFLEKNMKKE